MRQVLLAGWLAFIQVTALFGKELEGEPKLYPIQKKSFATYSETFASVESHKENNTYPVPPGLVKPLSKNILSPIHGAVAIQKKTPIPSKLLTRAVKENYFVKFHLPACLKPLIEEGLKNNLLKTRILSLQSSDSFESTKISLDNSPGYPEELLTLFAAYPKENTPLTPLEVVHLRLYTGEKEYSAIQESLIGCDKKGYYLWIFHPEKYYEKRYIKVSYRQNGWAAIIDGVSSDEIAVIVN